MQTIKLILITIFIGLTYSCTRKQIFNGFYFGRFETEDFDLPVLVRFKDNKYTDYFSVPYDTFSYDKNNNIFKFKSISYNQDYEVTIFQDNNTLSYYHPDTDTLIFRVKKSESSNFLYDYLTDKNLKIELPTGKGTTETYGVDYRFYYPMYFNKIGKDLFVNFNDTTVKLDNTCFKFLLAYKSGLSDIDKYRFPITLIADKNLILTDINQLKEQLRIVGYTKISYILSSKEYDKINYISRYIPPLSESEILKYETHSLSFPPLPPPPPEPELSFVKENGLIIESTKGQIFLTDKPIDKNKLQHRIKDKVLNDTESIIAYHITESSKYQDYIDLLELITNAYYDLRDDYLMSKYQIKYRGLWNIDNRYEEARKEIPMRILELDSIDYKTIKYAL